MSDAVDIGTLLIDTSYSSTMQNNLEGQAIQLNPLSHGVEIGPYFITCV